MCWPTADHPFLHEFAAKFRIPLITQQGDDLGPAEDGGYYLIGLRAACRDLFASIDFHNI